ncbi:MAG: chemotaxis protein, partial [Planctomycetota bacterium]|nr:chemotaxis protein [Planctomycetota bacterium]
KYFHKVAGTPNYKVDSSLKDGLTIAKLNLMDPWKMKGPFDAIFCRNVMIYMDATTREKLVDRFTSLIAPGGMLFIGTSERVQGDQPRLQSAGPSAYKRVA